MGTEFNLQNKIGVFQLSPEGRFGQKNLDVYNASTQQADIIVYDAHQGDNQKFILWYAKAGFYVLQAKHSGLVLDLTGWGGSGTVLCQYPYNGQDNQLWAIEKARYGLVYLTSKYNGLAVTVQGDAGQNRSRVVVEEKAGAGSDIQKFSLKIIEWADAK